MVAFVEPFLESFQSLKQQKTGLQMESVFLDTAIGIFLVYEEPRTFLARLVIILENHGNLGTDGDRWELSAAA